MGLGLLLIPVHGVAELPPYNEHHPRLFHSSEEWDALYEEVQASEHRRSAWQGMREGVIVRLDFEPWQHFIDSYAFENVEWFCLVHQMDPGPISQDAEEALADLIRYQIETYDAEVDDGLRQLAPTLRLHNLVWAYDNAMGNASETLRQQVVDEILLYLDAMVDDFLFTRYLYNPYVSNKGITIGANFVLAHLALAPDLPDEPLLNQARAVGEALLAKGTGDLLCADGSYHEGLGYMSWALRTLLPAWHALERLEGHQSWDMEQCRNILDWISYQMHPAGEGIFLNRNDHSAYTYPLSRHHSFVVWATRHGPDSAYARWLLRRISGDLGHSLASQSDAIATTLYYLDGPEAEPDWLAPSRVFTDTGFYVRRSGWPGDPLEETYLLTLQAGRFMGGHDQEDVGQVILRGLGHGFALDNGYSHVAQETEAHNLPLMGGLGQHNAGSAIGTDGELHYELATPFCEFIRADMTQAYTTHSPFNDPGYPLEDSDWSWGYDGGNPMDYAWREMLVLPGIEGEMPEIYLRDHLIPENAVGVRPIEWRQHMDRFVTLNELGGGLWISSGSRGDLRLFLHYPPVEEIDFSFTNFDNESIEPDTRVFSVWHEGVQAEFLWQWNLLPMGADEVDSWTERLPNGMRLHSRIPSRERTLWVSYGLGERPVTADGDTLSGTWGLLETEGGQTRTLLLRGKKLVENSRILIELTGRGSAAYDGETVHLSADTLGFRIWAPAAQEVLAWGESVDFLRYEDYVIDPVNEWGDWPEEFVFRLLPPWPNPGAPPLTFEVELQGSDRVPTLDLYDVTGRRVRRLCGTCVETQDQNRLAWSWDGLDDDRNEAANGIYLVRCRLGNRERSGKVLLLRRGEIPD